MLPPRLLYVGDDALPGVGGDEGCLREAEWRDAADGRLQAARSELLGVLDQVAAPLTEFRDAFLELLLASDPSLRERRGAKAESQTPPGLRSTISAST